MTLLRFIYHLFHGYDTRARIEVEEGRFSYHKATVSAYQRQGIEKLLSESNVRRGIIAIKRNGSVVLYGIKDPMIAQRIRNILSS